MNFNNNIASKVQNTLLFTPEADVLIDTFVVYN